MSDAVSRKLELNLTCLAMISVEPTIIEEVRTRQMEDEFFKKVVDEIITKLRPGYTIENQVLKFEGRLCVADVPVNPWFCRKPMVSDMLFIQGTPRCIKM